MPASAAGPAASAPPKCGASNGGSRRRGGPTTFRALPRRLSAANPSRGWRPRAAAWATSGRRKAGGPELPSTHRPPPMPSGTVFRLLPERVFVRAGKPASSPDVLRRTHARAWWRRKALANDALPRPEAQGVEKRPLGGVRATPEPRLSARRGQGRSRLSVYVSSLPSPDLYIFWPAFLFFIASLYEQKWGPLPTQ